jgi:eukaryotic-like serine/threonine-protein kinase
MAQDLELGGHVVTGRYRLVRRLGESPVAFYEARHPRLSGRFVARLWPATAPWDSFRRGAEIASALRHPGIVQVIDFNCEPGSSPFLITELIEGTTVAELLAANGLIGVSRVAALVESAAWSLAAAHQQGIVHQELEPACIYVVQAPGTTREWTKIDGFGLSAALVRADAATASPYRAPEQASPDDDAADPQSDQYALAAIAYEMLAGVRPFEDGRATSGGEPAAISELVPGVTPGLDAVIRQALSADPEGRYAGVLEFARALRDAARGPDTQVIRRRKSEGRAWGRAQAGGDPPVSPFFNPVQSPTGEGLRPVRPTPVGRPSTPAGLLARGMAEARRILSRVRSLRPENLVPRGASARAIIAGAALLFAIGGVAVVVSHPAHRMPPGAARPGTSSLALASAAQPVTPAAAPAARPPSPPQPAPPAPALPSATVAAAPPPAAGPPAAAPSPPPAAAAPTKPEPPAAAAERQPASETESEAAPDPEAANAELEPKVPLRRARPRGLALTRTAVRDAAAGAAANDGAACAITVASKPRADVWLDEHNVGRRTPLNRLRVACGDHKLVLRRDDLDLYQMEVITVRPGAPFRKLYPLQ